MLHRDDQEEKRGNQRGENSLASNQFPMCSPQSGTLRDIHRVTQRRKGKRERERERGQGDDIWVFLRIKSINHGVF